MSKKLIIAIIFHLAASTTAKTFVYSACKNIHELVNRNCTRKRTDGHDGWDSSVQQLDRDVKIVAEVWVKRKLSRITCENRLAVRKIRLGIRERTLPRLVFHSIGILHGCNRAINYHSGDFNIESLLIDVRESKKQSDTLQTFSRLVS